MKKIKWSSSFRSSLDQMIFFIWSKWRTHLEFDPNEFFSVKQWYKQALMKSKSYFFPSFSPSYFLFRSLPYMSTCHQSEKNLNELFDLECLENSDTDEQDVDVPSDAWSIFQHLLHTTQQHAKNSLLYVVVAVDAGSQRASQLIKHILRAERKREDYFSAGSNDKLLSNLASTKTGISP